MTIYEIIYTKVDVYTVVGMEIWDIKLKKL